MSLSVLPEAPPLREDASGTLRVGSTRVALDSVVSAFVRGATPEEIADDYPSLDLADVYDVIAYYLRRREEVDHYLQRQQEANVAALHRLREAFPQSGLRRRLTARRKR